MKIFNLDLDSMFDNSDQKEKGTDTLDSQIKSLNDSNGNVIWSPKHSEWSDLYEYSHSLDITRMSINSMLGLQRTVEQLSHDISLAGRLNAISMLQINGLLGGFIYSIRSSSASGNEEFIKAVRSEGNDTPVEDIRRVLNLITNLILYCSFQFLKVELDGSSISDSSKKVIVDNIIRIANLMHRHNIYKI